VLKAKEDDLGDPFDEAEKEQDKKENAEEAKKIEEIASEKSGPK
jgi:hypothetical protein